ncbi:MAG: hypothetical protein OXG44_01405 [Gammaproteobacteria bacterium]|nr:hypothetical protein [Gammaproteobacteria bacterium]
MDLTAISSSGVGLFVIGGLLYWQRANLAQIYLNVIIMAALLVSVFGVIFGALRLVGVGEIVLPLTSVAGAGLLGVAGVYAEKAKPFKGLLSPLNLSAIIAFSAGLSVILVGIEIGLDPFLQAQQVSIISAAQGAIDGAKGAAAQALLLLLTPLFVLAITVVTNFATRDANGS